MTNNENLLIRVTEAIAVRRIIQSIYIKHNVKTELCYDTPNSHGIQTDENYEGIICEFNYGKPEKIYTPICYLTITSDYMLMDMNAQAALDEICVLFGFNAIPNTVFGAFGLNGPLVNITKVPWIPNGVMQCNTKLRNKSEYLEPVICIATYSAVCERMQESLDKMSDSVK